MLDVLLLKKKRKTQIVLGVLGFFAVGLLVISKDYIREELRMRKVEHLLEASASIKKAYGSDVSVKSLERGEQGGVSMALWDNHITLFRVIGDGIDETISVRWSHPEDGMEVEVQGFSDKVSTYIDPNGTLE